jgi:hypothetical protein
MYSAWEEKGRLAVRNSKDENRDKLEMRGLESKGKNIGEYFTGRSRGNLGREAAYSAAPLRTNHHMSLWEMAFHGASDSNVSSCCRVS